MHSGYFLTYSQVKIQRFDLEVGSDINFFLPSQYDVSYDSLIFQVGWLNAIREWQEEFVGNMSSREFVDIITRDLLGSRVFVFTPKGEVKTKLTSIL